MKPSEMVAAICDELEVPQAQLKSRRRTQYICDARHLCWYYLRERYGMSYCEIRDRFNMACHVSVMRGVQRIQGGGDQLIRWKMKQVERRIGAREV